MPTQTLRKPVRRAARATFSDELRDAIDRDGRSPYAISKAAGVDAGILSRFLSGQRGITSDTIDRLASALGLHLGTATRSKGRPRREAPGIDATNPELDVPDDQAEDPGSITDPGEAGEGTNPLSDGRREPEENASITEYA